MAKCHENVNAVQRAWQEEFYEKNWSDKRTIKTDRISVLRPNEPNGNRTTLDFQTFGLQQPNSHRIFALTMGFEAMAPNGVDQSHCEVQL
ncbi:hypothetical protein AVEN_248643-1 [Araneus ventricosus]|uniref:DUF4817 domain-containing protein n=1 Tax=Araneus ventricosus TaxID=182803 RepID=A0A4Y2C0R9_ARAVE|nr:hypothetical protein AVEN_248643-1 [Araneus ventricosus]